MSNQKITIHDIIEYLKGTASQHLLNRIEEQRMEDIQFDEEMIDWEAYISTSESRKEAISRIGDLHDQWRKPLHFKAVRKESHQYPHIHKNELTSIYKVFLGGISIIVFTLICIFLSVIYLNI